MPDKSAYDRLPLGDAIRKFADHHYDPDTRHIHKDEYDLLRAAAYAIDQLEHACIGLRRARLIVTTNPRSTLKTIEKALK